MSQCARLECQREYSKAVHNQIYCSKECARICTNARILAEYHAKRNRKPVKRTCKDKECGTILSIYNEGTYCSIHEYAEKLMQWAAESYE